MNLGPNLPSGRTLASLSGELRASPVDWSPLEKMFLRLCHHLHALTRREQDWLAGLWRRYQEEC